MPIRSRLTRRRFCALAPAAASLPLLEVTASAADAQTTAPPVPVSPAKITVPAPRREFRGVWVASVDNIDWPSRRDLTPAEQQAELLLLLDRALQLNQNAILLQVRPSCDALYASPIEPWSVYLTGQGGKPPEPFYDPLAFAVSEAHRRGIELHAWCNPFRVRQSGVSSRVTTAANHVSQTHPEWVRTYGKMQWLDPGDKAARDYSLSVFRDIVSRYDIDGIHIDDYFYPYQIRDENDKAVDFPDDTTFGAYTKSGGTLSRSDWRRSNIDDFVARMYSDTKALKPWVKVGISPFGIWRPGYPAQIKGLDSFEELYGDSRRWLREGWVDYVSPQLYWKIEQTLQSFPVLLAWWLGENVKCRHVWPGLYASLAGGAHAKWPQAEIEYQIKTTRGLVGANAGQVHFSGKFLLEGSIADDGTLPRHLLETVYGEPVPVPEVAWLAAGSGPIGGDTAPAAPTNLEATATNLSDGSVSLQLRWASTGGVPPWLWLVQWRVGGVAHWYQSVLTGDRGTLSFAAPVWSSDDPKAQPLPNYAVVRAVNRVGTLGGPAILPLPASAATPTTPPNSSAARAAPSRE